MLYKVALCDCNTLTATPDGNGMVKLASGGLVVKPGSEKAKIIQSEIDKHPTALFFRSKAIKADEPNSNGDYFSKEELLSSYKSFEGVPFFTNHDNQNVENARGKVIHAEWKEDENSVYAISFVDREAYPHICRSIEEEYITGVSMGAVCGGTKILMADLTEKNIEDIKEGDIVLSHKGIPRKVLTVHNEFLGKKMYKLDMSTYHKSPLFTNDHPIFTIDKEIVMASKREAVRVAQNNKYERKKGYSDEFIGQDTWRDKDYPCKEKQADCIQKGDFVLIPSKFDMIEGTSDKSDFYYLVGAFLGDGYLKKDKKGEYEAISFCIGMNEIELAGKIHSIIKKYSKAEPHDYVCVERNGIYISVYDRDLANWFAKNVGTGSHEKRIKFNLRHKEDAKQLLAGYLDTDGCIVDKTNTLYRGDGFGGFQISSCNKELLEDVQQVIIGLENISRISTFARKASVNSVVNIDTIENTLAIGSNASDLFKHSIKFNNCPFDNAQVKAGKTFITHIDGKPYMACPIKSIAEVDFNEPVYDLTVEGEESYIADGLAIHNCSVDYSICNICGNKAEKTEDYCSHIRNRKGRTFSGTAKNVKTGEVKEFHNEPVFEYNYGIKFIELSAVVDPACPSCRIDEIICNDDYLKKVANIQNNLYMIKTAAIQKQASQEDLEQLNQALSTLEDIAVGLIQNRQKIEVDFASDLVKILSELQTFVDELTGAGFGQIPGVSEAPPAGAELPAPEGEIPTEAPMPEGAPPAGAPAPMPVSNAVPQPVANEPVGTVSGLSTASPTAPTMPQMPILSFDNSKLQKVASIIPDLKKFKDKIANKEEENMGKRRTPSVKKAQNDDATKVLSNLWQEKKAFLQYIKEVPSINNNNIKLSIKQRDDSFIIIAEDESNPNLNKVWTFEDLTETEKEKIKVSPKEAAGHFIGVFANSLKNIKEGDTKMTEKITEAGAQKVNKAPEVIQEAQLDGAKDIYHPRTGVEQDSTTQKQLAPEREGEQEVLTEKQLESKRGAMPREDSAPEVTGEAQLETTQGASPRTNSEKNEVTQGQLRDEGYRTHTEPEVITEKQLNDVDTPWARAASRDSSMFKSANEHMEAVVDALADSVIETGCTSDEVARVAASLVNSTKARYNLGNAILSENDKSEKVNYSERLAFWSGKIKVASVGSKEITDAIISNLRKVASDITIDPEVVITAVDVATEDEDGVLSVTERVEEKLASTEQKEKHVNVRSELKGALKSKKAAREDERKEILASIEELQEEAPEAVSETKEPEVGDYLIETSFDEMGIEKTAARDSNFKTAVANFTRGALASQNMKLASIINVTIDGETVAIAVQTEDGGSVEIPIGQGTGPELEETVPEAPLQGEGLEGAVPSETSAFASDNGKMKKKAQDFMGGGVGGPAGGPAGGTAAPAPSGPVGGEPVQSLTEDVVDIEDEIPTAGEQQMPYAICPECGSNDVDVETGKDGGISGSCNNCGAEYEALIKKDIEFTITKPTKSVGEEGAEIPEAAEVPALPVAAQTKIGKDSLVRIASNRAEYGHVCPACGMKECDVTEEKAGTTKVACRACGTESTKDLIISTKNPDEAYLRVSWNLMAKGNCEGCEEARQLFASKIKVQRMMKDASSKDFPMANCKELVAKKYGGNTMATYGPCKGQPLADCICSSLEKLGMTKVRHMERLASVSTQEDPMDECIKDHVKEIQAKKGETIEAATNRAKEICECMKEQYASEDEDNIFLQAFEKDIEAGKEKTLTASDLREINAALFGVEVVDADEEPEEDIDMADIDSEVIEEEEVTISLPKQVAEEVKEAIEDSTNDEVEEETEAIVPIEDDIEIVEDDEPEMESATEIEVAAGSDKENEKEMALAMQTHKLRRVGEEVVKVAGKPTKIETVEKDVEAGVPRSDATMGNESSENINVPLDKPKVPRGSATMGHEETVTITLPDVPVDSSYMGDEAKQQEGTPAINNEIKGTVIAEGEIKVTKEAKQLKEVETVEKDVEAGVPRSKATMGNEGKDNIDVPLNKPKVPRADATMGNEGADNINPKADGPDVPVDNAYMGDEKAVQSGMPAINDEILKQVQQSANKEKQQERIANARKIEAIKVASKLLASNRITEAAYDDVVEALSSFQIDEISVKASAMYPDRQVRTASVDETGHSIPAIVMESKEVKTAGDKSLTDKLTEAFTIGSSKFDKDLVRFDMK